MFIAPLSSPMPFHFGSAAAMHTGALMALPGHLQQPNHGFPQQQQQQQLSAFTFHAPKLGVGLNSAQASLKALRVCNTGAAVQKESSLGEGFMAKRLLRESAGGVV
jgi:hypothetical protein